jgi:RNA polymerase sigma factor (sigma-70 family)
MMTTSMLSTAANNDADLVNATLSGNRDAFTQIVSRYQRLICSLTYSATGNLGQSEDLAQETFITAWKNLALLRDRDKLRQWLCGIARNRVNNFLRREGSEPVRQAVSLEDASESHSPEPLPADQTISREEQAILWRSLERIPEIYREPLVLFYRENQSIAAVAEQLELTEENVKQRLSRGRKLLQEQVVAFVEGALERTNPGKVFTAAVIAALPSMAVSSKAAVLGAVGVKGAAAAKSAGMLGLLGAIFGPVAVIFGNYASYRISMDTTDSDEERGYIKRTFQRTLFITLALTLLLAAPLYWACRGADDIYVFWALLFCSCIVIYFLTLLSFAIGTIPPRRRYLSVLLQEKFAGRFPEAPVEYRSRLSLFGLPLVHVRLGDKFDVLRGPVKAWIAIGGTHAIGVIFAYGTLAVAPISFGAIAIGVLPFGAVALGAIPLGALSLGIWAYGGLAFGWQAYGGCAIAWNAATGAVAFARDFAVAGVAHAAQVNTEIAKQFFADKIFFQAARAISGHGFWMLLVWVIPVTIQSRILSRARRMNEQPAS